MAYIGNTPSAVTQNVTSAGITDGTIQNVDIAADAAIAATKIAGLSTVATSGAYADITGTPAVLTAPAIVVTVSGGKFYLDGTQQQRARLTPSLTYRFDQSHSSNSSHPLLLSTTSNGTHASGSAFTTGVTTVGTAGSAGAYVEVTLEQDAPYDLFYYCANHSNMGGSVEVGAIEDLSDLGVTATAAQLNILSGATLSTTELNYVDGVTSAIQTQLDAKGTGTVSSLANLSITATAAELNVLDGIPATLTATELGYVDGVTSAIQTQLNAKGTGTVSSLSDLSVTATAAELNTLDGVPSTLTATELGYVDGVTSAIQTQLDAKLGATYTGDVDITGELLVDSYNETYAALSGATPAVNCEAGNSFSLVLSAATTFTFTNPPASGTAYTFSLEITQDSGGSGHAVTWPTVTWPSGTAPTLTATANGVDYFVFTTRDGGTTWRGFTAGQALA